MKVQDKETLFYEEYAQNLEKGIEFTYQEFERQKKDEWMQGYNLAYRFYIFHGTLDIPLDYIIDGFPLGHWIDNQRKYKNVLTINQKKLLDNLKMQWHIKWNHHKLRAKNEIRFGEEQYAKWIENWKLAKDFFEQNGHLNIPADYKVKLENGKTFHLGAWLQNQKMNFNSKRLPAERMSKLDTLFAVFDSTNQKEIQRILNVKDHNFLPPYLKNIDPFKEKPIDVIFNGGHLTQKMRLQRNVSYLKGYFDTYHDLNIPQKYSEQLEDGTIIHLGVILTYIRKKHREGTLDKEVAKQLEEMNIVWNPRQKAKPITPPEIDSFETLLETATLEELKQLETQLQQDYPLEQADEVELEYLILEEAKQKSLTK